MLTANDSIINSSNLEGISVSRLADLYCGTIEGLRDCANLNPHLDNNPTASDLRESALLDFEETLLEKAARIRIQSKEDMRDIMDIWAKASCVHTEDEIRPSDRIAMNIFRHMSDVQFAK